LHHRRCARTTANAVRSAEEGADIVAIDQCDQIDVLHRVLSETTSAVGPIDIVVANAAIAAAGAKANSETVFRDIVGVNLTGVCSTVMAAAPSMREAGKGGPIHGAVGLKRSFAHWPARDGIRVNIVHPAGVETPMIMRSSRPVRGRESGGGRSDRKPSSGLDASAGGRQRRAPSARERSRHQHLGV